MTRAILLSALIFAAHAADAQSIRVIDGDTVDAGYSENVRLTLNGGEAFDAPETWQPECTFERMLGEAATARVRQLVASGEASLTILPGRCGFGRLCGALSVNGVNVGDTLLSEGLAVRSRNADWCR